MAKVSAEIDVHATPAAILDVIADLASYPQWSPVHRQATIDTTTPDGRPKRATMAVAAAGLTDQQTLDYQWSADGVSWSLVKSGMQRRQEGSYSISRSSRGWSHVRYHLSIDPLVPLPGILVRAAMRKAVAAAMDGLKQRVESLHDAGTR